MKAEYDKDAQALYIALVDIPNGGVAVTKELIADTVMLDLSKAGDIIGIEVLGVESIEHIVNTPSR